MATAQEILYTWDYDDTKDRSALWYLIALSVGIWLIIWGIFTRQYGMSIVILLIIWFFYFLENNSEDHIVVRVTELGIWVQDMFYDFSRIASYGIVYNGDQAVLLRLILKKRGIWMMNLRVDNKVATELRSILPNYIEEISKQELSFLEKLTQLLKL